MRVRRCALPCALLLVSSLLACQEAPAGAVPAGQAAAISTGGVNATMAVDSWGAGYCASITLANTSTAAVTSWTLVVALDGTTLGNLWGGTSSVAGGLLTIRPVDYDANIAAGASVSLGFCGTGSSTPALQSLEVTGGGTGGPTTYTLAVSKAGAGSGAVASSPSGIDCGATCSASYASGTTVTLTATPGAGSTFAGWGGACAGTAACTVAMTAARTVTATFDTGAVIDATVSVNAGGAAAGTFVADAGFTGGSTYSTTTAIDTSLVPSPVPAAAVFQTERYGEFTYTFGNRTPGSAQTVTLYFAESYWTAAGQRTFDVSVNGATALTAFDIFAAAGGVNRAVARTVETTASASGQVVIRFAKGGGPDNPKVSGLTVAAGGNGGKSYTLTALRSGSGTGTISGAGLDCGATCAATYASGAAVTLTATPAGDSTFGGWSGACSGSGTTCTVAMTADRSVTATFVARTTTYALTVTKAGTGSGAVASTPSGIDCGTVCSAVYASGASVTLTATGNSGSTFAGWSGGCTGTGACVASMTAARAVTATFNAGSTSGSAGCGRTSTLSFTTVPGESGSNVGRGAGGYVTIQSGGGTRGFAVRLPDNYDRSKPYWLIFGFHWNGGTAKDVDTGGSNGYVMAHFGLQSLSKNGAIFVAPQGLNNGWANSGGQDLKFVDDMVKLIEDNYCVDTTHVFTNGFSYGGGMSYEIACARAKVFRGAAIYEGAQLSGCDGGNDPIALWQMVGLEDNVCSMSMATPIRDRFVRNNGCTAQSPPQPPKAPPYLSSGGHVCTNYSGCSAGHPIRWCVHQSGHGNAIVDGTGDLYNSCATPPKTCSSSCPCTWVPDDVWKFFTAL